jgi:hypothetical protein
LGPIRAIRAGIDGREHFCEALHHKFFHKPLGILNASSPRVYRPHNGWPHPVRAVLEEKTGCIENPYFIGVFDASRKNRALRRVIGSDDAPLTPSARVDAQHLVSMRVRTRFIMRKHWFFCRAVVIRMQCSRSPRALYDIATHSWLGGQHGEEAKDEGESGGEEGRKEDQAPEEEVSTRRFTVFDFERRR